MTLWCKGDLQHVSSVLLTRDTSVPASIMHALVLNFCVNQLGEMMDILWLRAETSRNRRFPLFQNDDGEASSQQLENVFERISIKYVRNVAELKALLLNVHLFPRPLPQCLIVDDLEYLCGSSAVQAYVELAALGLEALSSTSPDSYKLIFVMGMNSPTASTTQLRHFFQVRLGIAEADVKGKFMVASRPHGSLQPSYLTNKFRGLSATFEEHDSSTLKWCQS